MNSRKLASLITEIIKINYNEIVEAYEAGDWDELEDEIEETLLCMD